MNEKRKLMMLAAATGILAGLAACAAQKAASAVPAAATNPATTGQSADGRGDQHGCGQHEGGACGAHDDPTK